MSTIESRLEEFEESTYLASNPDVAAAVERGEFSSGFEHYLGFGCRENRRGVPAETAAGVLALLDRLDGSPMPPPALRARVHGSEERRDFEVAGRLVATNVHDALRSLGMDLTADHRVLDFGCGCGRVFRWLRELRDRCSYHGVDIDAEAIDWCRRNLAGLGEFVRNETSPPLPFPDGHFDFVYSISVFTHLPEDMEFQWLGELSRVTKRGGALLLTVHGEALFPAASPGRMRRFLDSGYCYWVGANTPGLPDFYQTSFHTSEFVRRRWSEFFEVVEIIPKGIASHQDAVLCRKRG